MLCFLTDPSHKYDGYKESESSCKSVYNACQQSVSALYICQRNAENRTVRCDQRQINAERIVERLHGFFQEHLDKLHQSRDDKDEYDRIEILEFTAHNVWIAEDKFIDQPGH